jgi:hypothetical protein
MSSMHAFPRLRRAVTALCGSLLLSLPLSAQVTSADVLGTVTDASGAVVPGAKVRLTNIGTHVTQMTASNSAGDYVFSLVMPGDYSITVAAPGFKAVLVPSIAVVAGDRDRENATLQAGAVNEVVTVTADAPLLQRESSSLTSVVTEQPVQDLPLNGRNVVNLIQIQPGINAGSPAAISSGNRPDDRRLTSTISANGQSDLYNNQMIDGIDNNEREQGVIGVRPSIDAIAEVKVDTNNFTAEEGRDAGAVVDVITKSGTDKFHGSVYEFFRNDIFDARDFNAKAGVTAKPEYRQNQFGGSIGGPIVKDKTFFFGDMEDDRIVVGNATVLTVPTLYEEQHPGDFTDIGGLPQIFPNTPTGLAYFKLFPAPNTTGTLPAGGGAPINNYDSVVKNTQNTLTADGRIDHHFGNGDLLYGRYSYNSTHTYIPGPLPDVSENGFNVQPGGALFGYNGTSVQKAHGFILDYVHPFTENVLLEAKAGYTRLAFDTVNLNNGENISDAFGVVNGNSPVAPGTSGLTPIYLLSGPYPSLGDSPYLPIQNTNNVFQYQAALTYTHGTHTLKFGGELIRRQLNYLQSSIPLGTLLFTGFTVAPGITPNILQDVLGGYNIGYERGNTLNEQGFRMWEPSGYAQDDWRVTPNLTFNIGLRYDLYTPLYEAHNRYANFDLPSLKLITGTMDPNIGIQSKKTNVAPRIGFSASLGGNTVLRGGFGISYYPVQSNLSIQLANPPNSYLSECIGCLASTLPVPTPSSTTNLSGQLSYAPHNYNTSTLEMYNLALQRDIAGNVLTVAYVGELGRHQIFESTVVNTAAPNGPYPTDATTGPSAPPALTTAAALPNVQSIDGFLPAGTSNYNALQVIFARRMTKGLMFNSNYTYARSLTDAVGGSSPLDGNGLLPNNPSYDYGNSSNDVRHRIATSLSYELSFAKDAHGAKALLGKGWSVNFIDYWQTGLPFTVTDAVANAYGLAQINLPYVTSDRPNVVPGARLSLAHPTQTQFFNTAAFTPQPAGTAGNEHENQLYGTHQRRADLSLFKAIDLPRQTSLQFRAECYNISNTPNFVNPVSTISSFNPGPAHGPTNPISAVGLLPGDTPSTASGFGSLTQTTPNANPRQFQFALKLLF